MGMCGHGGGGQGWLLSSAVFPSAHLVTCRHRWSHSGVLVVLCCISACPPGDMQASGLVCR
jgi:hypothetical protein